MIDDKNVLAVISARGGSKGIVNKNIKELAGKPLIAWTIKEALKSIYIDRLVLSSDSDEIITVAKKFGCEVPFKRPAHLAEDNTPGIEPVLHAMEKLPGYEYVVLLQPTSPLRIVQDIDNCIEFCISNEAKSCVSITEPQENPYWMFSMDEKYRLKNIIDATPISYRQGLPKVYSVNGAVYCANTTYLNNKKSFITKDTIGFEMPPERSIDIDNEFDFFLCQLILGHRNPSDF